jgi:hypothetical protein
MLPIGSDHLAFRLLLFRLTERLRSSSSQSKRRTDFFMNEFLLLVLVIIYLVISYVPISGAPKPTWQIQPDNRRADGKTETDAAAGS